METEEKQVPDLCLEQLLLGELGDENLARELEKDKNIKKRLEELKQSDNEILFSYPPHRIAGEISEKLNKKKISIGALVPRLASALAALAIIIVAAFNIIPSGRDDGNRIKGSTPHLEIYRQEFNGSETKSRILKDGETLSEYDRIQISYIAAGRKYGIIFSIDGNGYVSVYHPDPNTSEPLLDTSGKVNLNYSLILDDAPLFEKYYFITSSKDFNPDDIIRKAEDLAGNPARVMKEKLDLPPGFEQNSVTFYKEEKQ